MKLPLLILLVTAALWAAQPLTPAAQKIAWAQAAIEKDPTQAQPYNELALAFVRRARETGDSDYYTQAKEAVAQSLKRQPGNFEGRKARVQVLLGQRQFACALEEARALNREVPDDQDVYAMIADGNFELGNYKEAEKAAQTMLDMRGLTAPALIRAARLREIFNEVEGALDFLQKAYRLTQAQETEERAWILTRMAHLEFVAGRLPAAEKRIAQALDLFPGYPFALEQRAKLRARLPADRN